MAGNLQLLCVLFCVFGEQSSVESRLLCMCVGGVVYWLLLCVEGCLLAHSVCVRGGGGGGGCLLAPCVGGLFTGSFCVWGGGCLLTHSVCVGGGGCLLAPSVCGGVFTGSLCVVVGLVTGSFCVWGWGCLLALSVSGGCLLAPCVWGWGGVVYWLLVCVGGVVYWLLLCGGVVYWLLLCVGVGLFTGSFCVGGCLLAHSVCWGCLLAPSVCVCGGGGGLFTGSFCVWVVYWLLLLCHGYSNLPVNTERAFVLWTNTNGSTSLTHANDFKALRWNLTF